ncbi:MAG: hypothetical protein IT239_04940 [Bacteroidia bacterium]|nr:hypothetical protein [Bacteroidia bacterium]
MPTIKPQTTRQVSQSAKAQVKKLFAGVKLPRLWVTLFIHDNPSYIGLESNLRNVKNGLACPPQGMFNDLKKWVKKNKIA